MQNKTLFDKNFQKRVLQQIIFDTKFGAAIIPILHPSYFDDEDFRLITLIIGKAFHDDDIQLTFPTLKIRLGTYGSIKKNSIKKEKMDALIDEIEGLSHNDYKFLQKEAMTFCKQQELKKAIVIAAGIIDDDDGSRYYECEDIIKDALAKGEDADDGNIDVFNDLAGVLDEDFRSPIATGISGMDASMGGGLSKGELGVVLAPYGVGKTTILTKIANEAKNQGYNVLQIFFEDMPKVIQRKHLSCWSGIALNDLSKQFDEVMAKANIEMEKPGQIILKKMSSDGPTMPMIKQAVKKLISNGVNLDMVIVDYIDVVQSTKQFKDDFSGEGHVMRQFESMLSEMNLVGWTAVQGNKSSISAEVLDGTNMGGSIKKGQIGHFIVGVAKTLEQKEARTATLSIIKSRFGRDGIIFEDCKFDNGTVSIDTNVSGGLSNGVVNDQKNVNIQNIIKSGFIKKPNS